MVVGIAWMWVILGVTMAALCYAWLSMGVGWVCLCAVCGGGMFRGFFNWGQVV